MRDGEKRYFVHTHSFIPKMRVQEHIKTDRAPYDLWIREGLITVTETMGGIKTDYKYILAYLQKAVEQYELEVQWLCYDSHNASAFLADLEALGYESISIVQSAKSLNDATVDFRLELLAGHVEHDGNGAMKWSIANARTTSNSFGEIKIDKDTRTERIDIIDAIIDAWTMAMKGEVKVDYNASALEWLEMYQKEYGGGAGR